MNLTLWNPRDTYGRIQYPLNGRYLVYTNSEIVEWMPSNKAVTVPVFSSRGNTSPFNGSITGGLFIIEAVGYLTFDAGSQFKIEQVGEYEKFRIEYDTNSPYFYPSMAGERAPFLRGFSNKGQRALNGALFYLLEWSVSPNLPEGDYGAFGPDADFTTTPQIGWTVADLKNAGFTLSAA